MGLLERIIGAEEIPPKPLPCDGCYLAPCNLEKKKHPKQDCPLSYEEKELRIWEKMCGKEHKNRFQPSWERSAKRLFKRKEK
jgi:hypothetical protein